jgi:hypothetical protein
MSCLYNSCKVVGTVLGKKIGQTTAVKGKANCPLGGFVGASGHFTSALKPFLISRWYKSNFEPTPNGICMYVHQTMMKSNLTMALFCCRYSVSGTLREVQAPLSPVSASAEPDILSLQSQFLLDGDAGVEMNRIGSSSRTTAGHRSQTTPTPTMAASELQKNTVSHDVTMLDPYVRSQM